MTTRPVVVVGDLMTDVIVAVDDPLALGSDTAAHVQTRQGGAGANVAAWLADGGVPVIFVGRRRHRPVRRRRPSRSCAPAAWMPGSGSPTRRATGTCVVLVGHDGERTMLPDAGANSLLAEPTCRPTSSAAAGHLHISGYSLMNPGSRDAALAALAGARLAAVPTSVDPASAAPLEAVGRHGVPRDDRGGRPGLRDARRGQVLCDSTDPLVVGARLTATYAEVVVKLGAQGAMWFSRDEPAGVQCASRPPPASVVDTTGAGDAFAAAWLAARRHGRGAGGRADGGDAGSGGRGDPDRCATGGPA